MFLRAGIRAYFYLPSCAFARWLLKRRRSIPRRPEQARGPIGGQVKAIYIHRRGPAGGPYFCSRPGVLFFRGFPTQCRNLRLQTANAHRRYVAIRRTITAPVGQQFGHRRYKSRRNRSPVRSPSGALLLRIGLVDPPHVAPYVSGAGQVTGD